MLIPTLKTLSQNQQNTLFNVGAEGSHNTSKQVQPAILLTENSSEAYD